MKYFITLLLLAFLAMPVVAAEKATPKAATEEQVGGFEGPVSGAQAETVEKAKKVAQDARVVLTGHIVSSVAGEKNEYIFKDATGQMSVIITPKGFKGNKVTPDTKVRIIGKVDKQASAPDAARVKVTRLEVVE